MDDLRIICARFSLNELVSAECLHLAGSLPDSEGVADHCVSLERVAQSAYLRLGVRCLAEAVSLDNLVAQVRDLRLSSDRFRIEMQRIDLDRLVSQRSAVHQLADAIEGDPDLLHPLQRFIIVVQKRRLWFGEIAAVCERAFRLHDAKPYHTTNSLPARLARGLVNLVIPPARSILDPFCGTGSILLEAQSLGLQTYGVDISSRMVQISKKNLAHFGYPDTVEIGNAIVSQQTADAIVTDLPYGRTIIEIKQDVMLEILKHLVELAPQAIYLAGEPLLDMLSQAGYRKVEIYCVRKRIGMQRFVHCAFL